MSRSARDIREALARKIKDEISGPALLRMIAEYDAWMVPNSFVNVGNPPQQYAVMFTDEEAYKLAQDQFGDKNVPLEYLQIPGSRILAMLAGSVDSISINPCSEDSIAFPKHLLPELVKWGQAIEVERTLYSVLHDDQGWQTIKNYDSYYVPIKQTSEGTYAPLPAPDSKGRNLLAVFTFSDALNAYVLDQHEGVPVDVTIYSGGNLCKWIVDSNCDGVVFNCCGPGRPAAFAKEFAKEVLSYA
ncbi:MAG TPA: hypothetical protein VKX17_25125 [Planctomycetota bacterium]|nr:hypothetical protein [Planctomycetota bacterium]